MIELKIDNLKALMTKEELTQAKLARKLGLSRACVNRHLKSVHKHPSAKFISAIREVFPEYSFDYFFYLDGTKRKQEVSGGK